VSSGGNSGSQATSLIIRAMALNEIRLRDWWRVAGRELLSGLALGGCSACSARRACSSGRPRGGTTTAVLRARGGDHRRSRCSAWSPSARSPARCCRSRCGALGFDPASASAPFVATLVDVTGLLIYFTVALLVLSGTLL
jgi:magnesium transporter